MMPLILAIEPDRRQAAQLSAVVRKRVSAELILVDTTERALDAIGNRMPDLVLVPALLSPQDDAALAGALRIIAAAARVQMLTIPVLGTARPAPRSGGMLSALRRGKSRVVEHDGCDPGVFAEQIASYLEHAARERVSAGGDDITGESARWVEASAPADVVEEAAAAESVECSDEIVLESRALIEEEVKDVVVEPVREIFENVVTGLEKSIDPDWIDPSVETEEPPMAAAADESVSIALEEAVRALFAELAVVEPVADPPAGPPVPVAAAAPTANEWAAVEELMAALEAIPLLALEVSEGDERTAPVVEELESFGAQPERVIEDPDGDDIDLSTAFKDADGQPVLVPAPARSEREWVALIESLRHDVERLRVERAEKPVEKPQQPPAPRATRIGRKVKPVQDEWGFFDPEQCGFAALLAKLDEVTEADEGRL